MSEYRFDSWINDLTHPHVICGQCALARCGLTTQNAIHIDLFTDYDPVLDGIDLAILKYYYKPEVDTKHYVSVAPTNPMFLMPTPERALVEYILNEKWCDEGTLIEALKTYEFRDDRRNFPLLYEVADFFGLPRETLDYWINEARTDEEV